MEEPIKKKKLGKFKSQEYLQMWENVREKFKVTWDRFERLDKSIDVLSNSVKEISEFQHQMLGINNVLSKRLLKKKEEKEPPKEPPKEPKKNEENDTINKEVNLV